MAARSTFDWQAIKLRFYALTNCCPRLILPFMTNLVQSHRTTLAKLETLANAVGVYLDCAEMSINADGLTRDEFQFRCALTRHAWIKMDTAYKEYKGE